MSAVPIGRHKRSTGRPSFLPHDADYDELKPLVEGHRKPKQSKLATMWEQFTRVFTAQFWMQFLFIKRIVSFFEPKYLPRTLAVPLTPAAKKKFPANVVRNQRYNILSFLPLTLFDQFKYFYNMYFLGIALTQFIPILQVGYLFTYWLPLIFVLGLAIAKEGFDDIKRWLQDRRANNQQYQKLTENGDVVHIPSANICCGDLILVNTNERIPADLIFLWTSEKSGSAFIRTDQLDGETDWKLRRPLAMTQKLPREELATLRCSVYVEEPKREIYSFVGKFSMAGIEGEESVGVDNTMWANTVLATGQIIGLVIYTGRETRTALNRNQPRSKSGITDMEINFLSKVLFIMLAVLSVLMVCLQGFVGLWYVQGIRFMILFSSIIPISMRVNLDMAKLVYSILLMWDSRIPGTIVRNSNLPEELGRINFLLSDKTGTLTQNDMVFKKLHIGSTVFRSEDIDDINQSILEALHEAPGSRKSMRVTRQLENVSFQVLTCVRNLALCNSVTPVINEDDRSIQYQASSPDEMALVKAAESFGVTLFSRDLHTIILRNPDGEEKYEILQTFPFSSTTKRMGIILRDEHGTITFHMKGADVVMINIIKKENSEWVPEETENMAREGLRTLVFASRLVTPEQYEEFAERLHQARCSIEGRDENVQRVIESLEHDLEILCVTGVEDKLQEDVRPTLEKLQAAGIKIWMLTGDKIETATCIAISARLFKRDQRIETISVKTAADCLEKLSRCSDGCYVVIDGTSLQFCLDFFRDEFTWVAQRAPAVVCCRCSPTQKAEIVTLIKEYTNCRTCAIGDGGNDVSMITAADVGVGIEGKEGKQASLAADFSLTKFSHVLRLIVWHGRNSYKRTALLAQFIIHRGLIISFIQAVFSALFFYAAIAIFSGWLLVGYSTIYTMVPVFSLVLDEDVSSDIAITFTELYKLLQKGRVLSLRTFTQWTAISVYQGGIIMIVCMLLFEDSFLNIEGITFTVLILTELVNIAFEIHTWNWLILVGELFTLLIYIGSIFVLPYYFDTAFILTWEYWWKVIVVTAIATLPISFAIFIYRKIHPALDSKVAGKKMGAFKSDVLGEGIEISLSALTQLMVL